MSGLVVAVGDRVGEGELIARYVDDAALAVSEAEVEEAEAQTPQLN